MNDIEIVEVLLVEDSDADAELTIRALKKHNLANRLVRVRDGVEALDFLSSSGPAAERRTPYPKLILLDIKMPKLDGVEVLRRIKSDEQTRAIPVVMLTSSAEQQDLIETYRLGVNSYLVKPVDFNQFVDVVAKVGLYWAVLNRVPG